MAFIFGGDTGETPESIARKRSLADALMRQPAPTDMWSGINSASGKIAGALIARNAGRREDEQRAKASEAFLAALGMGGQPAAAGMPAAPQVPQATPMPAPQTAPVVEPLNFDPARIANAIESPSPQGMALADAVQQVESANNPNAVSPKGATGLMQVMPATARDPGYGVPDIFTLAAEMGVPVADDSEATLQALLRDPEVNRAFGERYLNAMGQQFGEGTPEQLAAYNAGPGAVGRAGGVPNFAETQEYVRRVQGLTGQPTGAQPADGRQAVAQALASVQPPPQAPQSATGGINPALLQALANPFMDEGQRAVLSALVQQQMSGGGEPKRYTVGGSLVDASGNVLFSAPEEAEPGYRLMTPQEIAQTPGLDPSKPYQIGPRGQISAIGGGGVTVNTGDTVDEAFAKKLGAGQADMFLETARAGVAARGELSQIDELEALLAQGIGGNVDAFKVAMRDRFGIDIGMGGPVEAFTALINRLIPLQREPGSGPMSDKDIDMFKASLPQLVNSPEGNKMILDTMRAMAMFKRTQGEIANQVVNGRMTPEEGMQKLYEIPDIFAPFRQMREDAEAARKELESLR